MRLVERMAASLAPDQWVEHVTELTPEVLARSGLRGIIVDLDNTLCRWQSEEVAPEVQTWLRDLAAAGIPVCIASNTYNRSRLRRMAEALGITYVERTMKPRRRCFARALEHLGLPAEDVAIVGDQMFTDVLGGKRSGIQTIMVDPIHRREFIGTKLSRFFEHWLMLWFRRNGLVPDRRASDQDISEKDPEKG